MMNYNLSFLLMYTALCASHINKYEREAIFEGSRYTTRYTTHMCSYVHIANLNSIENKSCSLGAGFISYRKGFNIAFL